jgi:hypothetical protein
MPHDINGNLLKVGDKVIIPATVTAVQAGEEYCNLSVEYDYSMPPYTSKMSGTFNTKQVLLSPEQVSAEEIA